MKRVIAFFFVLLLIPSANAFADDIDWSSLSVEEITKITTSAYHELLNRQAEENDYVVIGENEDVKILFTHNATFYPENQLIALEVVFMNKTNKDIQVTPKYIAVDGWDCTINYNEYIDITANKTKRGSVVVRYGDAGYLSHEQIGEVEFSFIVYQNNMKQFPLSTTTPYIYISKYK